MNEMAQILGNLSKNSFKRKIWQTCPSAQCPFRQSVQSFHSFTHPSLRPSSPSLSACSLRLSALSVRPTVWQLSPLHPSTLYYLSIHSVHQSRPSSLSVCSVLPFVHPSVPLSVQFVCQSTLRMATRTAKNQYVKISKTSVFHVHRAFCTFLCRRGTNST